MIKRLLLATHNKGKLVEFEKMLGGLGVTIEGAGAHNLPEPEETETTFEGNALLKARAACKATGLPSLSDDSGLTVEALDGAPGIYSARWAGESKDFAAAMQRIHDELGGEVDGKKAAFVVVLALVYPDGRKEVFEGRVDGTLTWPPRGENGFGYDPMFVPDGFDITFGEFEPDKKDAMSHRGRAVEKLKQYLSSRI